MSLLKVKKKVTHPRVDADEAIAIRIFELEGERKYPGAEKAPVEFWTNQSIEGYTPEMLEKQGMFLFGMGGGRYDEHMSSRDGECATSLVLRDLGLLRDPRYGRLLDYALRANNTLGGSPWELNPMMKVAHDQRPHEPFVVLEAAWTFIDGLICAQGDYLSTPQRTELLRWHTVTLKNGKQAKVVEAVTDHRAFWKWARKVGDAALGVIQWPDSGHIQVLTNSATNRRTGRPLYDIDLDPVVEAWRAAELQGQEGQPSANGIDLTVAHMHPDVPNIYYNVKEGRGVQILNGSFSQPDVPVTRISREEVVKIVLTAISR